MNNIKYIEGIALNTKIEDLLTVEEKAIVYGVANGKKFNKEDINKQLNKARKVHIMEGR